VAISDNEDGAFDDGPVSLDLAREACEGVGVGLDLETANAIGDEEGVHAGRDTPADVDFGNQDVRLGAYATSHGRHQSLSYVGVAHGAKVTAGQVVSE
jgi:hypothetical protein